MFLHPLKLSCFPCVSSPPLVQAECATLMSRPGHGSVPGNSGISGNGTQSTPAVLGVEHPTQPSQLTHGVDNFGDLVGTSVNPTESRRSKAAGVDMPWECTVPGTETAWCLGVLASFVALIRGCTPGHRACKGKSELRLSPTPRRAQGRKPGKRTSNSSGTFSLRTLGFVNSAQQNSSCMSLHGTVLIFPSPALAL